MFGYMGPKIQRKNFFFRQFTFSCSSKPSFILHHSSKPHTLIITPLLSTEQTMDSSDEDKASLIQDGKTFYQEWDSFGSQIWVDRASLNCYKMGARGAPRGSLMCHSYSVLRTDNCRHVRGRCQATPWTGVHNHRNPEPQEIQYLKVQYHARVLSLGPGRW